MGQWYTLKPLLVDDINIFPIISCYPILGELGIGNLESSLRLLAMVLYFFLENNQPPEKGFLFGYPIVSKKHDGIMVYAETLAGG